MNLESELEHFQVTHHRRSIARKIVSVKRGRFRHIPYTEGLHSLLLSVDSDIFRTYPVGGVGKYTNNLYTEAW